jgi:hypothetical protein
MSRVTKRKGTKHRTKNYPPFFDFGQRPYFGAKKVIKMEFSEKMREKFKENEKRSALAAKNWDRMLAANLKNRLSRI